MASAVMMIGNNVRSWVQIKDKNLRKKKTRNAVRVDCSSSSSSSSSVVDPYKTLKIHRDASAYEVKKAFRRLALKYHPDVSRGNNCATRFHQIKEAYNVVMSDLRGESTLTQVFEPRGEGSDEPIREVDHPDWDLWEEWMGWEGAGIRDYSSHINPYI